MSFSDESDSENSNDDEIKKRKPKCRPNAIVSDETDSDGSIKHVRKKKKLKVQLTESDSSNQDPASVKLFDVEANSEDEEDESWSEGSSDEEDEDSEDGSETESSTDESEDVEETSALPSQQPTTSTKSPQTKLKTRQVFEDLSSSDSDENSEKCAICLRSINNQEVATPEACDHVFCSVCLLEWSKNNNKCPLDRQPFSLILIRENKNGKQVKQVQVEEPTPILTIEDEDDLTFCEICGQSDREDRMLLCDGCDMGFHMECLTPPLEILPQEEEWYCPDCIPNNPNMAQAVEMYDGELYDLLDDPGRPMVPPVRRLPRRSNRVVRTRQLLRVRNALVNNFLQQVFSEDESSSSSESEAADEELEEEEDISAPGPSSGPSTSRSTVVKTTRARKSTTRKKKSTTKKTKRPKTTTKKRKTTTKRASKKGTKRRTYKKRRTWRTKTKKILITNEDGSVTEEIVAERIYRKKTFRKRRKAGARRTKSKKRGVRRKTPRSSTLISPRTTKQRLVKQLGMLPMKPGQLLPSVKIKSGRVVASNSRAGLPTLRIFQPSVNDQTFAPESDDEFDVGDGSGGVSTLTRVSTSTRQASSVARRKAALLLRNTASQRPAKPRVVIPEVGHEAVSFDVLDSILKGQEEWHSKKNKILPEDKKLDVTKTPSEDVSQHAPMFPGQSSYRQTGYRQHMEDSGNSNNSNMQAGAGTGAGTPGGSRYGVPSRNDREGYTNYLNNSPGPTPYCRGGPPVWFRFRMRPPLVRNRMNQRRQDMQMDDEPETIHRVTPPPRRADDEDVDIYSDIESNNDKNDDNEGSEEFPALGPPPEPPAFLFDMGQDDGDDEDECDESQDKNRSDVYDPAEPCDSDEEDMVIDEHQQQQQQEQQADDSSKEVTEQKPAEPESEPSGDVLSTNSTELDPGDENSCPQDQIYSTSTLEFSQKEEEEREKELREVEMRQQEPAVEEDKKKAHKSPDKVGTRLSFDMFAERSPSQDPPGESQEEKLDTGTEDPVEVDKSTQSITEPEERGRSTSPEASPVRARSSSSNRSERVDKLSSPESGRERNKSRDGDTSDSDGVELHTMDKVVSEDEDKENKLEESLDRMDRAESESEIVAPKVAPGLEGLDVEEVSSENEGVEFSDRSVGSLSLSDMSPQRRQVRSPSSKKKKKKRKRKSKSSKGLEEGEDGEIDSEEKRSSDVAQHNQDEVDENVPKDKEKVARSRSVSGERNVLTSRENRKQGKKGEKELDLSWKKPSKKDRNYREGKRTRVRSKSREKRKSRSHSKEKKKSKDKKKRIYKKKDIERYDVRKVVKNKEVRKTDEFGRDIVSKSRSFSRSRSRSPVRSRNRLRRSSRSFSRSRSRSFRRGRSPVRRRVARTRSRSFSLSRSRSRSPRKIKKKKERMRSRSRSVSRGRRRSISRSPVRRLKKNKRRSWSRSPSFSPHMRPGAVARRSLTRSWSRGLPVHREPPQPLEKLTVVLTTKDKKKNKRKKENKKNKKEEEVKKKRSGNMKEVFASGDNILVSVNFKNNRNCVEQAASQAVTDKRRKRTLDYDLPHVGSGKKKKGSKTSAMLDVTQGGANKRAKKVTRLSEKDAEVILNRKPVAVIDLDISPYREQTPSPVNVVVVSDSGSGDEGKEQTLPDKIQDVIITDGASVQASSPAGVSYLLTTSGPKTPPEPHVKFSIPKPLQLRAIVNPLGEEEEEEEEEEEDETRVDLDRRIEKELETGEVSHKGPNTPPEPRPTTPSPDAYDPFEPTKSRSPSPDRDNENKETKQDSPKQDVAASPKTATEPDKTSAEPIVVVVEDEPEEEEEVVVVENGEATPPSKSESPDRKLQNTTTPQKAGPGPPVVSVVALQKNYTTPVVKQVPLTVPTSSAGNNQPTASPAKTTGIQRLQHRLGSPVNRSATLAVAEILSSGNYLIRNATKQNGQTRPTDTNVAEAVVDMVVDMDDSPYSPASSEGDDLFDPPVEPIKPPPPVYKPTAKNQHKSPAKQPQQQPQQQPQTVNKFDLLFGPSLSPLKVGANKKKTMTKANMNAGNKNTKTGKKGPNKKGFGSMKTDEDQLKILDELPSSAVELQVKDKFLKKLNRQERVIDEVKTVLKPHYAKRHVTKEEYKDILRKSVPKICHSRSGEINPSKIQQLIEAYVKKYRYAKKKQHNTVAKPKTKKTMFS